MKYLVVFGTLALALLFNAIRTDWGIAKLLLLSGSLSFAGVALAYADVGPRVFLKSPNGKLPLLSWMIFWPYHSINWWALILYRRRAIRDLSLYSNIENNVWLGGWLTQSESRAWVKPGAAVLDVAGELSENSVFRDAVRYLSLPTLDRCAPSHRDLLQGVDWIGECQKDGPVYVHCALGHGRSATFVAAYLLRSGRAESVEQALQMIRAVRPTIDLSPAQIKLLENCFMR